MRIKTMIGLLLLGVTAYFVSLYATNTEQPEFTIRQIQTIRSYNTDKETEHVVHVDAFRKDGASFTSETFSTNGKTASVAALQLPDQHSRIVMQPETAMKSTYPVSDQQVAGWKAPMPSDCSPIIGATPSQLVGTFSMYGVAVQRFVTDGPVATTETNMAPTLRCFAVRIMTKWRDPAGRYTSETVKDTVELKLGPPDPALFNVPNELVETTPSVARNATHEYLHGVGSVPTVECWLKVNNKLDARYTSAQALRRP
jgi:hypothetical protein